MGKLKWHIILALWLAFCGMASAEQLYVHESGWWRDGGAAYACAVAGDYVYLADFTNGHVILHTDVSVTPQKGDLDHDSQITPADAMIALQIAVGSLPCDVTMIATLTSAAMAASPRSTLS